MFKTLVYRVKVYLGIITPPIVLQNVISQFDAVVDDLQTFEVECAANIEECESVILEAKNKKLGLEEDALRATRIKTNITNLIG